MQEEQGHPRFLPRLELLLASGFVLWFCYAGSDLILSSEVSLSGVLHAVLALSCAALFARYWQLQRQARQQFAGLVQRLSGIQAEEIPNYELMIEVPEEGPDPQAKLERAYLSLARQLQKEHKNMLTAQSNFAVMEAELRTELIHREQQARKTWQDLSEQEIGGFLKELAGSVAHDINNPLTIVAFRSKQLKRKLTTADGRLEPDCEALFQSMDQAIHRIQLSLDELEALAHETEAKHVLSQEWNHPSRKKANQR